MNLRVLELQSEEQEDCGKDSNATYKGNMFDSPIQGSNSGMRDGVYVAEMIVLNIAAHCNDVLLGCTLCLSLISTQNYMMCLENYDSQVCFPKNK